MRPRTEEKKMNSIYTPSPLDQILKFVIAIYHYLIKLLKLIQVKQDKEWGGIVLFDEKLLNSKLSLDMNKNHFVETEAFISVFKALPFGI